MRSIAEEIRSSATEKIRAHERRKAQAEAESKRRQRRSATMLKPLAVRIPEYWNYDRSHDPYHVRARADSIGHAIELAVKSREYSPFPPAGFEIEKPAGGTRRVTAFAIADEVVSRRLYRTVLHKNRSRLSARSYAYRPDLGVHDAIAHIQAEWGAEHRLFVAQYDFQDFFGSIDHDHVWSTMRTLGLALTRAERTLLKSFMRAPLPTLLPAHMPISPPGRIRGIHQGTTISLLLANIAATPLDREFERLGVSFIRYADDIIIWSRDYGAINHAVDYLHRFAERANCPINKKKSPGVRLLVEEESNAEITAVHSVTLLSHRVALRSISINDRVIESTKRALEDYIYNHLLREPLRGTQDMSRLRNGLDRDYLALVWQLRRHLYGSLSEEQLRRLLRGPLPPYISLGGLLGRFPLANDVQQLRDLDAWLATRVWLALRKRERLLSSSMPVRPEPWGFNQAQLARFITTSTRMPAKVDGRLPSSVRMAELTRRAVKAHGTRVATHKSSLYSWD